MSGLFDDAEVISTYSRAQAIADGVLHDVSAQAREAGVTFPVALTAGVWAEYVAVPKGVIGQAVEGRRWDVVYMLAVAIKTKRITGSRAEFQMYVRNTNGAPQLVTLAAVCGPGDTPDPVVTLCLPGED